VIQNDVVVSPATRQSARIRSTPAAVCVLVACDDNVLRTLPQQPLHHL
jgi:hypothetical protein